MAAFDRIVIVDWSANATPKRGRDSIWVAQLTGGELQVANPPTRAAAIALLSDAVGEAHRSGDRVLVGVDFSLGFPAGTAGALDLDGGDWSAMWSMLADRVHDDERNRNNRFELASQLNGRIAATTPGPFWGCPPRRATRHLTTTKVPAEPLPTWRAVESLLRARGLRPFSAWQLLGAGAVGSQSLRGIAAVAGLVDALRARSIGVDVWPFTSGFGVPTAPVVVAEIWPSLIELDESDAATVRDRRQVVSLATHLASIDLAAYFAPACRADLDRETIAAALGEEGWILGVA